MEAIAGISVIIYLFLLVAGIMAIFIPFWVLRIKNETIAMNKRLDEVIKLLGGNPRDLKMTVGSFSNPVKTCPKCSAANRMEDTACIVCGSMLT